MGNIIAIICLIVLISFLLSRIHYLSIDIKNSKEIKDNIEKQIKLYERIQLNDLEYKFRVGDKIFVKSDKFTLNEPYYIIQVYNGNTCAIINKDPKADRNKNYSCRSYGVNLKNAQHERFPICPKCNQNL